MKNIVSTTWLNNNLNNENLIILDASPKSNVSGLSSEYDGLQIPNARFFDLKGKFSDKSSLFPNTIPTKEQFEVEVQNLGINQNSEIVVYDNLGIYSSPRVWWLFKVFGHQNVSVLDGGLPAWIQQGFQPEKIKEQSYPKGNFNAKYDWSRVKTYENILENKEQNNFTIVDARSSGRFNGTSPEPRKHLKSGNIPNSVNLPFQDVLNNGKFKSKEELKQLFDSILPNENPLTFSCGSGLTACIIHLAAEIAGKKNGSVYDGSWTEWAEKQELFAEE